MQDLLEGKDCVAVQQHVIHPLAVLSASHLFVAVKDQISLKER
jgi:hypothetical protein